MPTNPQTTLTRQQIEECRSAIIAMVMLIPEKGMTKIAAINELCNLAVLGLKFKRKP